MNDPQSVNSTVSGSPPASTAPSRDVAFIPALVALRPRPCLPPPRSRASLRVEFTAEAPLIRCRAQEQGTAWLVLSSPVVTLSGPSLPEIPVADKTSAAKQQPSQRARRLKRRHPSKDPIDAVELQLRQPPIIENHLLKFSCPACQHHITLPKRLAGHKSRCPQCSSAIRSPHPNYSRGAYNYDRCIESLLRPELFRTPAPRAPKFFGVPRLRPHSIMLGASIVILVFSCAWLLPHRFDTRWTEHLTDTAPPEQASSIVRHDSAKAETDAENLVRSFLNAQGWVGKSQFVRDQERVTPLMQAYYAAQSSEVAPGLTPKVITSSAPSYYYRADQLKAPYSKVSVEFTDGSTKHFVVEFMPDGPKIEWESSVAYCPTDWKSILTSLPSDNAEPSLLRVTACLDDYYNHQYADRKAYVSVYLQDALTGEPLGNGYISRTSQDGQRLLHSLAGTNREKPRHIMVEVRPLARSAQERIVEIVHFVKTGFRMPETTSVASLP
jgi:hypothetical protein